MMRIRIQEAKKDADPDPGGTVIVTFTKSQTQSNLAYTYLLYRYLLILNRISFQLKGKYHEAFFKVLPFKLILICESYITSQFKKFFAYQISSAQTQSVIASGVVQNFFLAFECIYFEAAWNVSDFILFAPSRMNNCMGTRYCCQVLARFLSNPSETFSCIFDTHTKNSGSFF